MKTAQASAHQIRTKQREALFFAATFTHRSHGLPLEHCEWDKLHEFKEKMIALTGFLSNWQRRQAPNFRTSFTSSRLESEYEALCRCKPLRSIAKQEYPGNAPLCPFGRAVLSFMEGRKWIKTIRMVPCGLLVVPDDGCKEDTRVHISKSDIYSLSSTCLSCQASERHWKIWPISCR
jgi:hypothetical protein